MLTYIQDSVRIIKIANMRAPTYSAQKNGVLPVSFSEEPLRRLATASSPSMASLSIIVVLPKLQFSAPWFMAPRRLIGIAGSLFLTPMLLLMQKCDFVVDFDESDASHVARYRVLLHTTEAHIGSGTPVRQSHA